MKYFIVPVVFFVLHSCSDNGTDSNVEEEKSAITDSSQAIDDFYGDWYLAAEIEGEWWHIEGCDNYSLHVTHPSTDDTHLGRVSMSDRIGLSVDMYARLLDFSIEENGEFIFNCTDEYSENADFPFSGVFHETLDPWGEEVIELDPGYLWDQLKWEVEGEVKSIILFKGEGARDFPENISEIECVVGDEFSPVLEDFVPIDGLSAETLSREVMFNLVSFHGTTNGSENEHFEYVSMMDYFILIRDSQDGDYTELDFYCLGIDGDLMDERKYSGIFEHFEDGRKYKFDENDIVTCYPGRWVPDEENEIVNLVTNERNFSINESGKFVDK